MYRTIGVLGGSGGVGASTFAAVLAAVNTSVLVDLVPASGGVDVLLGIDREAGARWSGVRVAGGFLDPDVLADGLPSWRRCPVLAADVSQVPAAAVAQVLDTLRPARAAVVDLPRDASPARDAAIARCDLVVVLGRCDPPGVVGVHVAAAAATELDVPAGLVVRRGDRGGGVVSGRVVADTVGMPLLGSLPPPGSTVDLVSGRVPRGWARLADGIASGIVSGVSADARRRLVGVR